MKKQTFMKIVELVGPEIRKPDKFLRASVPVEKRVAIALWRLATGNVYTVRLAPRLGKESLLQSL